MIEQPAGGVPQASQPPPETKIAIGRNATGRRIGLPEVLVAAVIYLGVQFAGAGVIFLAFGREALVSGKATPTLLVVLTAAISAGLAALVAGLIRVRSTAALGLIRPAARWLLIGAGCGLAGFMVNRVVVVSYVAITGDRRIRSRAWPRPRPAACGGSSACCCSSAPC